MVKNRNIALCIILSIITCGIYGIYWLICINNDMNTIDRDDYQTTGGMVVLLTIITCNIYGWYWAYRMGQKMDMLKPDGNHAILFIVLQLCGLGIVNYCIMQSEINTRANA